MSSGCFLNNKNKGFTLIELLVVISIIGLLSTIVLASVQKVRTDAKWRKFDSELIQIRTAVQLYRENHNGEWPNEIVDYSDFSNVLSELKTAGLYNSIKIIPPSNTISTFICNGAKAKIVDSCSCGNPDYANTNYVIAFYNYSDLYSPLPTKLSSLFFEGSQTSQSGNYYYCIDL